MNKKAKVALGIVGGVAVLAAGLAGAWLVFSQKMKEICICDDEDDEFELFI